MTFRARRPSNPLPGFNFAVSFGNVQEVAAALGKGGTRGLVAGFQEITGLEATLQMHEYREGGRNEFTHKFATSTNFGNITFKRGVALSPDLWLWFDTVRNGSFGDRRTVLIAHLDYGQEVAHAWTVQRALPTKFVGPSWNAAQSSVAVETLELAHEGLELVTTADL